MVFFTLNKKVFKVIAVSQFSIETKKAVNTVLCYNLHIYMPKISINQLNEPRTIFIKS